MVWLAIVHLFLSETSMVDGMETENHAPSVWSSVTTSDETRRIDGNLARDGDWLILTIANRGHANECVDRNALSTLSSATALSYDRVVANNVQRSRLYSREYQYYTIEANSHIQQRYNLYAILELENDDWFEVFSVLTFFRCDEFDESNEPIGVGLPLVLQTYMQDRD